MFLSLFIFLSSLLLVNAECPVVNTVENFNLTEYVRDTWYIQKQQVTSYLPLDTNYCVSATYRVSNRTVPFYRGTVLDVYNYADYGMVNGININSKNFTLCARVPNTTNPSKLLVAPCFLPNLFGGDYWVIVAGPSSDNYQYAVVSGGQPHVQYPDGCTTRNDTMNNSGLWLFTREQNPSKNLIEFLMNKTKDKGYTLSLLNDVNQTGCLYK